MVVNVVNLETEKPILTYDVEEEIKDMYEEALEEQHWPTTTPEYQALINLHEGMEYIHTDGKVYNVIFPPSLDVGEGEWNIFVEEFVEKKKTSKSRKGFGGKRK